MPGHRFGGRTPAALLPATITMASCARVVDDDAAPRPSAPPMRSRRAPRSRSTPLRASAPHGSRCRHRRRRSRASRHPRLEPGRRDRPVAAVPPGTLRANACPGERARAAGLRQARCTRHEVHVEIADHDHAARAGCVGAGAPSSAGPRAMGGCHVSLFCAIPAHAPASLVPVGPRGAPRSSSPHALTPLRRGALDEAARLRTPPPSIPA